MPQSSLHRLVSLENGSLRLTSAATRKYFNGGTMNVIRSNAWQFVQSHNEFFIFVVQCSKNSLSNIVSSLVSLKFPVASFGAMFALGGFSKLSLSLNVSLCSREKS